MGYNNTYLAITGEIMGETPKAIKFKVPVEDNGYKEEWFPISQLGSIHRTWNEEAGTPDVLMASEWILGQKGLKHLGTKTNPVTAAKASSAAHPVVPNTPPVKPWSEMDDDIPF